MVFLLPFYCALGILGPIGIGIAIGIHWVQWNQYRHLPTKSGIVFCMILLGLCIRWNHFYNIKQAQKIALSIDPLEVIHLQFSSAQQYSKLKRVTCFTTEHSFEAQIIVLDTNLLSLSSAACHLQFIQLKHQELPKAFLTTEQILTSQYFNKTHSAQFISDEDLSNYPYSRGLYFGLLFGNKSQVHSDLKSIFQSTGTAHALAISGLHVGLWIAIAYGIWFIPCLYLKSKALFLSLILITIWAFCYLSGFPISAIRACTVASLIICFKYFSLPINNLQICTWLWSILLIIQPQLQSNIGFILSFTAAFGLLKLMPIFQSIFLSRIQSKWLKYLFTASTVSFVAQLVTFPVTWIFFHTFPTYFLFSNIVVLPVISILLILFFLSNICALFFDVSILLTITETLIVSIKYYLEFLLNLPYSELELPNTNVNQVQFLVFVSIISIYLLLFKRRNWNPFSLGVFTVCYFTYQFTLNLII